MVGALSDGSTGLPEPFDLATSAALAGTPTGRRTFHIQIHEVGPGDLRREILNVELPHDVAVALLFEAAADLDEQHQGE